MGSLEVFSAADVLTLSDQHGLTFLKDAAMRFVASHAKDVMGEKTASPGWAHLKQTRPALIDEARAISLFLSSQVRYNPAFWAHNNKPAPLSYLSGHLHARDRRAPAAGVAPAARVCRLLRVSVREGKRQAGKPAAGRQWECRARPVVRVPRRHAVMVTSQPTNDTPFSRFWKLGNLGVRVFGLPWKTRFLPTLIPITP